MYKVFVRIVLRYVGTNTYHIDNKLGRAEEPTNQTYQTQSEIEYIIRHTTASNLHAA